MIVTHCLQVIWVSNEFVVCQCFLWLIWNCENDFKFGKEVFHMVWLIWIYQFVSILWSWIGNIIVLKLGNRKSSMAGSQGWHIHEDMYHMNKFFVVVVSMELWYCLNIWKSSHHVCKIYKLYGIELMFGRWLVGENGCRTWSTTFGGFISCDWEIAF